jgi:hypothetical protein
MIRCIASGGQTGADRAALDTALAWGIPVRGWVPLHRRAEDGAIPDEYPNLRETDSADAAVRTEWNVRDTDGTLIVSHGALSGGSQLTRLFADRLGRPVLHLDMSRFTLRAAVLEAEAWVRTHNIAELNVAGPRASGDPDIHATTTMLLSGLLARLAGEGDQ